MEGFTKAIAVPTTPTSPKKVEVGKVISAGVRYTTTFGYHDKFDSGYGSKLLSPNFAFSISTNNTHTPGEALPMRDICELFQLDVSPYKKHYTKTDWVKMQIVRDSAALETGPDGRSLIGPILDYGPGLSVVKKYNIQQDETQFNHSFFGEDGPRGVKILVGYYLTHPRPVFSFYGDKKHMYKKKALIASVGS